MKYLTIVIIALVAAAACDWKATEREPAANEAKKKQAATTGDKATPPSSPIPPDVYGRLVEQTLLKRQRDITVCTLEWPKQHPETELLVDVVFELDERGAVSRVNAAVPAEAEKIGRCIEAAIAPTKFPPGAPSDPFRKRMVFNPQDDVVKNSKLKGVLGADAGTP